LESINVLGRNFSDFNCWLGVDREGVVINVTSRPLVSNISSILSSGELLENMVEVVAILGGGSEEISLGIHNNKDSVNVALEAILGVESSVVVLNSHVGLLVFTNTEFESSSVSVVIKDFGVVHLLVVSVVVDVEVGKSNLEVLVFNEEDTIFSIREGHLSLVFGSPVDFIEVVPVAIVGVVVRTPWVSDLIESVSNLAILVLDGVSSDDCVSMWLGEVEETLNLVAFSRRSTNSDDLVGFVSSTDQVPCVLDSVLCEGVSVTRGTGKEVKGLVGKASLNLHIGSTSLSVNLFKDRTPDSAISWWFAIDKFLGLGVDWELVIDSDGGRFTLDVNGDGVDTFIVIFVEVQGENFLDSWGEFSKSGHGTLIIAITKTSLGQSDGTHTIDTESGGLIYGILCSGPTNRWGKRSWVDGSVISWEVWVGIHFPFTNNLRIVGGTFL
jgi:hypothetical protein